jgi:hypothetical protein
MSSVPSLPVWRLPVLVTMPASKRRRVVLVAAGVAVAAAVAAVVSGVVQLPFGSAATAPTADLAAAHAHAVALAKTHDRRATLPTEARTARPVVSRVADASRAGDLFATHSWYVPPPPPPPAAPAPPAPPTAPPFPYTYVGSFAPDGDAPVFFLARGDRVIDAHVGDHLDGVYEFEKADGGELVFNYLPLGIRQTLPGGVSQ